MEKYLNPVYPETFTKNKEFNAGEIKEGKIFLESKPLILMVVLTTRCNLRCIMCGRGNPQRDLTLAYDKVKHLTSLYPYLEAIDWQGGEVFLLDYFKDLFLEAAKYPNIDQSITTNGLLIDKEWTQIFGHSRVNLTFSIDAVTKETYEYIRKGAAFEDLLAALKLIKETNDSCDGRIQLHTNVVVMRSNYRQLHLFPEFCANYGIKHLRFDFLRPDVALEEDILLKPDYGAVKYLKEVLPGIENRCKQVGVWFEYTFKPFLSNGETAAGDNKEYKNNNLKCKLPWKKIFIDASLGGGVRPDCLCEKLIGNIYSESIEDIWNSDTMQTYRKKITNGQADDWCSKICLSNAIDTYQWEGGNR